jgi:hypothetical protein
MEILTSDGVKQLGICAILNSIKNKENELVKMKNSSKIIPLLIRTLNRLNGRI